MTNTKRCWRVLDGLMDADRRNWKKMRKNYFIPHHHISQPSVKCTIVIIIISRIVFLLCFFHLRWGKWWKFLRFFLGLKGISFSNYKNKLEKTSVSDERKGQSRYSVTIAAGESRHHGRHSVTGIFNFNKSLEMRFQMVHYVV